MAARLKRSMQSIVVFSFVFQRSMTLSCPERAASILPAGRWPARRSGGRRRTGPAAPVPRQTPTVRLLSSRPVRVPSARPKPSTSTRTVWPTWALTRAMAISSWVLSSRAIRPVFSAAGGGVGIAGRRRALPPGINEGEQLHIAHPADQVQGALEILLRLPREAHDDIAGEGDPRHPGPGVFDQVPGSAPPCSGGSSGPAAGPTRTAPAGAGALHRWGWAAMVSISLRLASLGVAGHEADVVIPRHGAQQVEQVGEVHLLPLVQPLAVAVDVLWPSRVISL